MSETRRHFKHSSTKSLTSLRTLGGMSFRLCILIRKCLSLWHRRRKHLFPKVSIFILKPGNCPVPCSSLTNNTIFVAVVLIKLALGDVWEHILTVLRCEVHHRRLSLCCRRLSLCVLFLQLIQRGLPLSLRYSWCRRLLLTKLCQFLINYTHEAFQLLVFSLRHTDTHFAGV